jgi:hypothetical protein
MLLEGEFGRVKTARHNPGRFDKQKKIVPGKTPFRVYIPEAVLHITRRHIGAAAHRQRRNLRSGVPPVKIPDCN